MYILSIIVDDCWFLLFDGASSGVCATFVIKTSKKTERCSSKKQKWPEIYLLFPFATHPLPVAIVCPVLVHKHLLAPLVPSTSDASSLIASSRTSPHRKRSALEWTHPNQVCIWSAYWCAGQSNSSPWFNRPNDVKCHHLAIANFPVSPYQNVSGSGHSASYSCASPCCASQQPHLAQEFQQVLQCEFPGSLDGRHFHRRFSLLGVIISLIHRPGLVNSNKRFRVDIAGQNMS